MLAQATGSYFERPVRPELRDHFARVWVHRLSEGAPAGIVVAPDGAIDLQWVVGRWRVAGPDRHPQTELLPAGAVVVGFRFQPASATPWLGVSASELCNQRIDLEDLSGSHGRRLNAAAGRHGQEELVDHLEGVIAQWSGRVRAPDAEMKAAYHLLAAGAPTGRHVVSWLVGKLAVSERTLRRRFEAAYGYGPKTLDRILRFQRFLDLTRRNPHESTAERAAAAGYADQPHLVHECRRLALCTPSQLI
jgi:AraC-like DNA-binding protein